MHRSMGVHPTKAMMHRLFRDPLYVHIIYKFLPIVAKRFYHREYTVGVGLLTLRMSLEKV